MLKVVFLALVQGVAEFLPISSSGHLAIGKTLLGMSDMGLRLDICLHVGTLVAVFLYYRARVFDLIGGFFRGGEDRERSLRYAGFLLISAVPAGLVGIHFYEEIERVSTSLWCVGFSLLFTGAALLSTRFLPRGRRGVSLASSVMMGLMQAIAVLPGVSRSGMTLVGSRLSRVEAGKAAEFSFLMSAIPIGGAALLEIGDALTAGGGANEVSWALAGFGAVIAAVVGYVSLVLLVKSLRSEKFWLFGIYCFAAGLVAIVSAKWMM